jgi:hypothetical protein
MRREKAWMARRSLRPAEGANRPKALFAEERIEVAARPSCSRAAL